MGGNYADTAAMASFDSQRSPATDELSELLVTPQSIDAHVQQLYAAHSPIVATEHLIEEIERCIRAGDTHRALELAQSASAVSSSCPSGTADQWRGPLLQQAAQLAVGCVTNDRIDACARYLEWAIAHDDTNARARAAFLRFWADPSSSPDLPCAENAGTGWSARCAALAHLLESDFAAARELDKRALSDARATGDRILEAAALEGLGLAYSNDGDNESSIAALREAAALFATCGLRFFAGKTRLTLTDVLDEQMQGDAALAEARSLRSWVDAYDLQSLRGPVIAALAVQLRNTGDITDASAVIRSHQESATITGTPYDVIGHLCLADLNLDMGDIAAARTEAGIAHSLAHDLGHQTIIEEASRLTARIDIAAGNIQQGLIDLVHALDFSQPVYVADAAIWLARRGEAYDSELLISAAVKLRDRIPVDATPYCALVRYELDMIADIQQQENPAAQYLELATRWEAAGRHFDAAQLRLIAVRHAVRSADTQLAGTLAVESLCSFARTGADAWTVCADELAQQLSTTGIPVVPAMHDFGDFAHLSISALASLSCAAVGCSFERGAVLCDAGEIPAGVFLIERGSVRLVRRAAGAKELILATVTAGSFVGETAADGHPAGAIAQAESHVVGWLIPRAELTALVERYPVLSQVFAHRLSQRLHKVENTVEQVAYWNVVQRVAAVLLELSAEHGTPTLDGGTLINCTVSQSDIASMIGATRKAVADAFATLREADSISMRKRSIVIQDYAALRRLASSEAEAA